MIYNYITTNLLNGKQYIGMHVTEVDDGYLGMVNVFQKNIREK